MLHNRIFQFKCRGRKLKRQVYLGTPYDLGNVAKEAGIISYLVKSVLELFAVWIISFHPRLS